MIQFSKHGCSLSRLVRSAAIAFLIAGCASASGPKISAPVLAGIDDAGNKIYFSGTRDQIMRTLENYSKTYDTSTLEGQIDYLLFRLQTTQYKLERNGAGHTPEEGANFLRWKMKRPKFADKVSSIQDFVTVICSGSSISGKPYVVILPDGTHHNLESVFQNELDLLIEFQAPRTPPAEASPVPATS